MMAVIQNAFANTSSSLMIAKVQGNIGDTLMPPLSPGEILVGYTAGGVAHGLLCALAAGIAIVPAVGVGLARPLWALAFVLAGSLMLSLLGLPAAIHAERFDQMAAITNFVVTPLSFLSGTFYSIDRLPAAFRLASHANPVFYLIDGFRYGVIGIADSDPRLGLAVAIGIDGLLWWLALRLLASGYRLKG